MSSYPHGPEMYGPTDPEQQESSRQFYFEEPSDAVAGPDRQADQPAWNAPSFDGFKIPTRQASLQAEATSTYVFAMEQAGYAHDTDPAVGRVAMTSTTIQSPPAEQAPPLSYDDEKARRTVEILARFVNNSIRNLKPTISADGYVVDSTTYREITATTAMPPTFRRPLDIIRIHDQMSRENLKILAVNQARQAAGEDAIPFHDMRHHGGYFDIPLSPIPDEEGVPQGPLTPLAGVQRKPSPRPIRPAVPNSTPTVVRAMSKPVPVTQTLPTILPGETRQIISIDRNPSAAETIIQEPIRFFTSATPAPRRKRELATADAVMADTAPQTTINSKPRDINRAPIGHVDPAYAETFTRLQRSDINSGFFQDAPAPTKQPRALTRLFRKLLRKA